MQNNDLCKCKYLLKHNKIYSKQTRGPSSYFMHNPEVIFKELNIKEGYRFLDLGCGAGDYSIQAAKLVGDSGIVYSLDKREQIIYSVEKEVKKQGLMNVQTLVSSIEEPIPIDDDYINICLISTVLHAIKLNECQNILFNEICRILKPDGQIAIIEIKKIETSFGPPMINRWSSEELEEIMKPYGFRKISYLDLGCSYMIKLGIE